jgi:hypothetical protein
MTDKATNQNPNQDIIAKVRKLLRHGDSAQNIGNLEEAQAFAAKAQELMFKHKIEMSAIEAEEYLLNEPITEASVDSRDFGIKATKRIGWWAVLINGLAKAYFCRAIGHTYAGNNMRNTYTVHGRETDRKEMLEMLRYLTDAVMEMAEVSARNQFTRIGFSVPPAWRNSFKLGFANAVYNRMEEDRKNQTKKLEASNEQGLVFIGRLEAEMDEYIKARYKRLQSNGGASTKGTGYGAGAAYGRAIGINSTKRLAA